MNLAHLQHLYAHDGPFLSLHLDVSRGSEDAAKRLETHWETARAELSRAGAASSMLDRVGELVQAATEVAGPVRRTVVAVEDDVLMDDVRAGEGSWGEVTDWGPLPDVSGWLAQVDGEFPFVLVLADKEGADIDVYRSLSKPETRHREVQGETLHIHKVPAGEWAELQHSTEEVWRRNARNVADAVRSAQKEHRPRAVLLAGDVRARTEIHQALDAGGETTTVFEIESGGRAKGSSAESLWTAVHQALAQLGASDQQVVVDALDEQSGQGRAIARGLRDVLGALVRGQVDRLVVDLAVAHEQTVAPRDYPGLQLPTGAEQGRRLPADQVLVAAGAATDAELSVPAAGVIGGDGIAALLRWDT